MSNSIYIKEDLVKSHHHANRYIKFINYIIDLNKNRNFANILFELHHILPRSMGGSNSNDNLIKMTLREHYIAHAILFYTYRNSKMARAFNMMNNKLVHKNSRLFEKSKEKIIPLLSRKNGTMHGKVVVVNEFGKNITITTDEYKNGKYKHIASFTKYSDGQRAERSKRFSGSNNPSVKYGSSRKGAKLSKETKEKLSKQASLKTGSLNNNAKKVSINNIIYGSGVDAAKALGVTKKVISYRCKSTNMKWLNWFYV